MGRLSTGYGCILGLRMEKRPPVTEGGCEFIVLETAGSPQGAVLQFGSWSWVNNTLPQKISMLQTIHTSLGLGRIL
jgi:hypothetical protein